MHRGGSASQPGGRRHDPAVSRGPALGCPRLGRRGLVAPGLCSARRRRRCPSACAARPRRWRVSCHGSASYLERPKREEARAEPLCPWTARSKGVLQRSSRRLREGVCPSLGLREVAGGIGHRNFCFQPCVIIWGASGVRHSPWEQNPRRRQKNSVMKIIF